MKTRMSKQVSMPVHIIGAIVVLLISFGFVISALGYLSFTTVYKNEYAATTYHIADTAAAFINGDHVDKYLEGEEKQEYQKTCENLDQYCDKIHVSLVYLIKVDTSDYGRFVSVFNSVNNDVDNTEYKVWELGFKRDTTNDEYRQKYKAIYEEGSTYETVYRLNPSGNTHPHITALVPVKDSDGKVNSILCIQRPVREIDDAKRPYFWTVAISTLLLALAASAFSAFFIHSQVIAPIRRITEESTRFAKESTKGEELIDISQYRELEELASSINTMETDMVSYIENLTSVTADRERIVTELSLARTIQENSIPNVFPAFPNRKDFDIYATMDAATLVGGDFYNFFLIDDDHLAMVIGDVSGKGVPASLFMMVTNILISDRTNMGGTPTEILTYVNKNLCAKNKAEMFVTIWLGILQLSTGKLTATNAGHEYPAIKCGDGGFELFKDPHSFVIGGMPETKYKEYEIQMQPGDKIFIYTDGIPEATDINNKFFGTERMLSALNAAADQNPEKVLMSVHHAVDDFAKDAEQFDDLTMLCMEYKGNTELEIEALEENLEAVQAFVNERLKRIDCPMKAQMQINLSVEEIFINIAKYAYAPDKGNATIRVEVSKDPVTVTITFVDHGVPYDPLAKEDPDIHLTAAERQIGGLGIFMTKQLMDDVSYTYHDGMNILTLKKNLS